MKRKRLRKRKIIRKIKIMRKRTIKRRKKRKRQRQRQEETEAETEKVVFIRGSPASPNCRQPQQAAPPVSLLRSLLRSLLPMHE